jgi:hypothetical protein
MCFWKKRLAYLRTVMRVLQGNCTGIVAFKDTAALLHHVHRQFCSFKDTHHTTTPNTQTVLFLQGHTSHYYTTYTDSFVPSRTHITLLHHIQTVLFLQEHTSHYVTMLLFAFRDAHCTASDSSALQQKNTRKIIQSTRPSASSKMTNFFAIS